MDGADGNRRYDREILRLAVPAFGALAAEPIYVLVDTAIVGRLGTRPLAALGIAGALLTAALGVFNFLAYGTTATVARRVGAGDPKGAAEHGVAGLWLALILGVSLLAFGLVCGAQVVDAMGASSKVAPFALTYLRISLLGVPFVLLALAGTGYLRGLQNTRTPFVIAVVANVVNLVLELVFVYGLDLGIAGSAWGTVIAQFGAAVAYLAIVQHHVRAARATVRPQPRQLRLAAVTGAHLTVRTASLLVAFTVASAIAARLGDVQIAAHQVAFQVWFFLALTLDAIAIAAQAIVGKSLGASDEAGTRAATRRMMHWGLRLGLALAALVLVTVPLVAVVFTHDPAVRHELVPVLIAVAVMQPLAAAVFVLDGILIGAGDVRYLALAMVAATLCFLPFALAVLIANAGLVALWGAIYVFMLARWYGMVRRYKGRAWLVTGAAP